MKHNLAMKFESAPALAPAAYTINVHGEVTHIEIHSRIADRRMRTIEMGPMKMIVMRCGALSIRRYADELTGRSRHMSTFILQLKGTSSFNHYGHQIVLGEGDISLCNNNAQYELHHEHRSEVVLFRVPTAILNESIPTPDFLCGRRLGRHEHLASTATAMARDLADKSDLKLPAAIRERAGRHLLDVLASSYAAMMDDCRSTSAIMSGRFWRVRLFIEEHLRDPDLTPTFIAGRLKLSDRYLRMIFAVSDESLTTYILRRRLEESARQLRDPRWRGYSITDVAFGWGFNSSPHFTRSFRARYGCTPRTYRQLHLDADHPHDADTEMNDA